MSFFRVLHKWQTPHSRRKSDPSAEPKVPAWSFCCPGDKEVSLRDLFHPLVLLQPLNVQLLINIHRERLMETTQLNATVRWDEQSQNAQVPKSTSSTTGFICKQCLTASQLCSKFRNLEILFLALRNRYNQILFSSSWTTRSAGQSKSLQANLLESIRSRGFKSLLKIKQKKKS